MPPAPPQLYTVSSYYAPPSYYRHGPQIFPTGYVSSYPPDHMGHLIHAGSLPGLYHTHASPISATRSTNAEDSDVDTDGHSEDEHESDHEDAESDFDEHAGDQDEPPASRSVGDENSSLKQVHVFDQQLKRPENDRTRSEEERDSSPVDDSDFERESTAKVSPSLPASSLASVMGPSRLAYLEDLEEDTLSPRMRDVALDEPLLIMARVSSTRSPLPTCLPTIMYVDVRNRFLHYEHRRSMTIFIATLHSEH